jgi:hypothetical protein
MNVSSLGIARQLKRSVKTGAVGLFDNHFQKTIIRLLPGLI